MCLLAFVNPFELPGHVERADEVAAILHSDGSRLRYMDDPKLAESMNRQLMEAGFRRIALLESIPTSRQLAYIPRTAEPRLAESLRGIAVSEAESDSIQGKTNSLPSQVPHVEA